jgi:hypothetical protein
MPGSGELHKPVSFVRLGKVLLFSSERISEKSSHPFLLPASGRALRFP